MPTVQRREAEQTAQARLNELSTKPLLVQVPRITFLMIDGRGDPNTAAAYRDAIEALYSVSYSLKFALKRGMGLSHKVGPLEGLWWAADFAAFAEARKEDWQWTMMIAQPEQVQPDLVQATLQEIHRKKPLPALDRVRLEPFEEGLAAEILHQGPYATEGSSIEKLHQFIQAQGYSFDGRLQKHHEIYLSDPKRTAPERILTIVRQPVVGA